MAPHPGTSGRQLRFTWTEGGEGLALRFTDRVDTVIRRIATHSAAGSPRYEESTKIAGLRSRQVRQFPYVIFYVEVLRVLHAERDLMAELSDADDEADA